MTRKIADFCLSSCLEEKQNQAIASKQSGSMWSTETGMDSSSVVQVSSLMACSTNLIFLASVLHFSLSCSELVDDVKCRRLFNKEGFQWRQQSLRYWETIYPLIVAELEDIQAEDQGATSGFRADKP